MSADTISWPGIHFNQSYIDYKYDWNYFSTYLAIIPWIYIIPSFIVICKIFKLFLKLNLKSCFMKIDKHVLLVICLSQLICFGLFFFDYLMTRLPATGIFTSYCASIAPNHWLKMIVFLAIYFTYLAMSLPFLMPLVRLFIVIFPNTHNKINSKLLHIGVPILFVYPILFTFYFIPALGVCKPTAFPYPFGSINIYYTKSAFGLRNSFFHLYNIIFWVTASVIVNVLLFFKVVQAKSQLITKSKTSYKAEWSITITTLSMVASYIINGTFLILYIHFSGTSTYMSYGEIVRPFGNDIQACVVTWMFYLTHPVFEKKKNDPDTGASTSSQRRASNKIMTV